MTCSRITDSENLPRGPVLLRIVIQSCCRFNEDETGMTYTLLLPAYPSEERSGGGIELVVHFLCSFELLVVHFLCFFVFFVVHCLCFVSIFFSFYTLLCFFELFFAVYTSCFFEYFIVHSLCFLDFVRSAHISKFSMFLEPFQTGVKVNKRRDTRTIHICEC